MDKITALLHDAKIEADENRSKDTRYFAASVVECVESLRQQLAAALAACEEKDAAFTDISEYWNQCENEDAMRDACWHSIAVADTALAIKPDASALKQHDAELIERCADKLAICLAKDEPWEPAIRELKAEL